MTSSSTKSLIALLPNTSFQRMGDSPVPGLLVVKLSTVNTSPFFIFFAATILFLAIAIFSRSESDTILVGEPKASSIFLIRQ